MVSAAAAFLRLHRQIRYPIDTRLGQNGTCLEALTPAFGASQPSLAIPPPFGGGDRPAVRWCATGLPPTGGREVEGRYDRYAGHRAALTVTGWRSTQRRRPWAALGRGRRRLGHQGEPKAVRRAQDPAAELWQGEGGMSWTVPPVGVRRSPCGNG